MHKKRKHFMKLTALAAALLLAGCSMAPKYERPEAPVPQFFPNGAAQTAGQPASGADRLAGLLHRSAPGRI